jgi:hypothetical protein
MLIFTEKSPNFHSNCTNMLLSVFVLQQSRKDAILCGKAACTNAVHAHVPAAMKTPISVKSNFHRNFILYNSLLSEIARTSSELQRL